MRRRICSIGPTDIYVHLATGLFGLYVLLSGARAMALAGFLSILLHEGAHALAAAALGQPPREMEITPMGAVLRLEDEQRLTPGRRVVMLAAGPAMTGLLAFLALRLTVCGWLPVPAGRALFLANAAILMVNLLPALPLDGGRLLSVVLAGFMRGETVARILRGLGTALGLACVGGSLFLAWRYGGFNGSLAAAGCFLMYAASTATTTQAMAELRRLMERKNALEGRGYAPVRRVAVIADVPLHRAVRLLRARAMTELAVTERGTMRVLGVLTEAEAVSAWLDAPQMRCGEALADVNYHHTP